MKNNRSHLFLTVILLFPITSHTNPNKLDSIIAITTNDFDILSSLTHPLNFEKDKQHMSFQFRELQVEEMENLENLENMRNTENMEEEANLNLPPTIGPSSCEIDSTSHEHTTSSVRILRSTIQNKRKQQAAHSNARRLQIEGGGEVNFQGYSGDGSCEIDEKCKRKFIFGLGFITVCKNIISCEVEDAENNANAEIMIEQVCQTVRKCACIVRPGIGRILICRNQLVCG